jgi:asparagine synthase (glutamine-hydrolysing)
MLDVSVRRRLVADVPVGLFVSGGLDSGIVAAVAAKAKSELDCFSIGFDEPSFDESVYSKTIAASLGIRHHLKMFTGRDMLQLLEQLPRLLDEPLADPSVFPLYLLSKFAAGHLKVVLSGDGGDELFAGYQTFQADKLMRYYSALPGFVKNSIRTISQHLPVSHDYLSADYKIKQFLKADGVAPEIRFFLWRGAFSPLDQHALLTPDIRAELGDYDTYEDIDRYIDESGLGSGVERLLYLCMKLYLQDNNLVTVDRASMANGLEVRCRCSTRTLSNSFRAYLQNTSSMVFERNICSKRPRKACCLKLSFIDRKKGLAFLWPNGSAGISKILCSTI